MNPNDARILSTWQLSPRAVERLRTVAARVDDLSQRALSPEELEREIADCDGLIVSSPTKVDASLLAAAKRLRVVATVAVGHDNIDLAACAARGIKAGNTPRVVADATADIAMSLILASMRRIVTGVDFIRAGAWGRGEPQPYGNDLAHKTLGIYGMGAVGSAVAERARAAKMRIVYHNRHPRADAGTAEYVTFERLLAESDTLVVTAPLTPQTRGIFDADAFGRMKPGAYFINVARGGLVRTGALYDALKDGPLAFAGLDVTDPEPLPLDHPLWTLPNLVVTPHVGTRTPETREEMLQLAVSNVVAALREEPLPAEIP